jgi:hypothetical protein
MRATRWFGPILILTLSGCVEQILTVKTDPPGAVIYMNNQLLGSTPLDKDFTWYGNYQVEIRKDGYEAIKTHKWIKAPWWNWPPFDLLAELGPWHVRDHKVLTYKLTPSTQTVTAPGPLMERAVQMEKQLRSSESTRHPSTQPSPVTKPSKK